jgi:hypothetical protein
MSGEKVKRSALALVFVLPMVVLGLLITRHELQDGGRQAADHDPAREPSANEAPPPAPSEIWDLVPTPIPEAVRILQDFQVGQGSAEERLHLAEVYKAAGFYGASRFFENSAHVARSEPIDLSPVKTPIAWAAEKDDLTDRGTQVATEVVHLTQAGRYADAAERAKQYLEAKGGSLQVVVQWADATLWNILAHADKVSAEAQEAALRVYLTWLEEKVFHPIGTISRAGGYSTLSDVFFVLGDHVSALTAAAIGIRIAHSSSGLEVPGPVVHRRLCDRAASLKRELGFPEDQWLGPARPYCEAPQ